MLLLHLLNNSLLFYDCLLLSLIYVLFGMIWVGMAYVVGMTYVYVGMGNASRVVTIWWLLLERLLLLLILRYFFCFLLLQLLNLQLSITCTKTRLRLLFLTILTQHLVALHVLIGRKPFATFWTSIGSVFIILTIFLFICLTYSSAFVIVDHKFVSLRFPIGRPMSAFVWICLRWMDVFVVSV